MSYAKQMLEETPATFDFGATALAWCIDACFDCEQACVGCADACLAEEMVADLRRCITLCLNCGDQCAATGRTLSRQTAYIAAMTRALLEACATTCSICADECERHASRHGHCRVCAEACRECEQACRALLDGS
jgi:hypothetical protein